MKIDLYFSYRSPYSYLILPRMLKLKEEYDIEINFKVVYPIAIRMPEWFEGKNIFTYFFCKMIDMRRQAKKLGVPFTSKHANQIDFIIRMLGENHPDDRI